MAERDEAHLLDGIEADLEAVERALGRLDAGSYATCEVCAAPIADERLADDPLLRRCPEHEQA